MLTKYYAPLLVNHRHPCRHAPSIREHSAIPGTANPVAPFVSITSGALSGKALPATGLPAIIMAGVRHPTNTRFRAGGADVENSRRCSASTKSRRGPEKSWASRLSVTYPRPAPKPESAVSHAR